MRAVRDVARRGGRARSGASAVEFGLLAPVYALILVGVVDFGGLLYVKFNLDGAVSSAANYALVNSGNVNSTNGSALAAALTSILAGTNAVGWATASVVVDNGPSANQAAGASTMTTSGTAANADACYCPTSTGASFAWGSATTCGANCSGGGLAGKFVTLSASRAYTPIFSAFGLLTQNTVSASAIVETY